MTEAAASWFNNKTQVFFFFSASLTEHGSSRLGVKCELQLPAYTTATATPDLSHICDLHHSSSNAGSLTR